VTAIAPTFDSVMFFAAYQVICSADLLVF